MRRDHQESQEWLQLATEIVNQSNIGADRINGGELPIPIPLKILANNQQLANVEINQEKVNEIKQALNEYQRLKEIEDQQQAEVIKQ